MKKIIVFIIAAFFMAIRTNGKENSVQEGKGNILIGIICGNIDDIEDQFADLHKTGFNACQLSFRMSYDQATADRVKKASSDHNIKITTLVAGGSGGIWTFLDGPSTIGLVPRPRRQERMEIYKKAVDFCVMADIPAVHSHFGFIPEDPRNELYGEYIATMRDLATYAKERGINLYCETGQETPVTLIRSIQDIGTGNVFINCDLANLVMYGKANPLDAVKMFGPLIKEFHAKDGLYPTDPYLLGKEVNIPEGEVDFPAVIRELKKNNFDGALIIEHEFGDNHREYFIQTKKYLEDLMMNEN